MKDRAVSFYPDRCAVFGGSRLEGLYPDAQQKSAESSRRDPAKKRFGAGRSLEEVCKVLGCPEVQKRQGEDQNDPADDRDQHADEDDHAEDDPEEDE